MNNLAGDSAGVTGDRCAVIRWGLSSEFPHCGADFGREEGKDVITSITYMLICIGVMQSQNLEDAHPHGLYSISVYRGCR